MCGIAGILSADPLPPESADVGKRMLLALNHRGPDGEGVHCEDHLWVGMRRLSIIDLESGWQPIYNEDKTLALVANGEIYNFLELREDLIKRGHVFRSGSDCETIVHLYEEHGDECVNTLRGMFAFALWDLKRDRLLLARDRMGEKPLYIYRKPRCLYFCSELRPLISSGIVPFEINPHAVDLHLHYGYVPEPHTMLRGVTKLGPGHTLAVDLKTWSLKERRYWRISEAPPIVGDPVELLKERLAEIGSLIIRSDVPVGVALSGGMDSSLVAALAAHHSPATIQSFTVGYEGNVDSDERADARRFADFLGIPWHEVVLSTQEVVDGFTGLVSKTDDPIADIAGYGYFAVMRAARHHGVPVMIQGQGGDELFWGYPWVREAAFRSHLKASARGKGWKAFPAYLKGELPRTTSVRDVRRWFKNFCGLMPAVQKISADLGPHRNEMPFYNTSRGFLAARRLVPRIYTKDFRSSLPPRNPFSIFDCPDLWDDIDVSLTSLICDTYLLENGIAQGDRLSMASSVELRLPLVDYRLVETVVGIRKSHPDHSDPPKNLLRKAASNFLPDWVMNRRKRGFSPPVGTWLHGIHSKHNDKLGGGFLVTAGFLDRDSVNKLARNPFKNAALGDFWFSLIVLETWCRELLGESRNA